MTTDSTTTTATDAAETKQALTPLSAEQEINTLRAVHQFLSNFDRVPGFMTSQWSQALDAIAVVANSLISKTPQAAESAETVVNTDTDAEAAAAVVQ